MAKQRNREAGSQHFPGLSTQRHAQTGLNQEPNTWYSTHQNMHFEKRLVCQIKTKECAKSVGLEHLSPVCAFLDSQVFINCKANL